MCLSFMISIAARCSEVCGWGQVSLPAAQEGVSMQGTKHLPRACTNEQEGCVHDGCTVKHGGHEDIVARAVNERHVSRQVEHEGIEGRAPCQ